MAAENFEPFMKRLLGHEGGYSVDVDDPGNWTGGKKGAGRLLGTKYGIAANTFPNLDIKNLTWPQAVEIYRKQYAKPIRFDDLPHGVDIAILDYAINSGAAKAVKSAQAALGVIQDGVVGVKTLEALQTASYARLVEQICDERLAFMRKLSTWPKYKNGWTRRVNDVRKAALALCSTRRPAVIDNVLPPVRMPDEAAPAKSTDTAVTSTSTGQAGATATGGGILGTIVVAGTYLAPYTEMQWVKYAAAGLGVAAAIAVIGGGIWTLYITKWRIASGLRQ